MRRSRFTITATPPNSDEAAKFVVLAYAECDARDFYTERGYCVLDVTRGDHRAATGPAANGFSIDLAALAEAIALFGLKFPVDVVRNARRGSARGNHSLTFDARHRIMVKSYLDPEQASRTLWHELTHAMQAERAASAAGATTPREIRAAWTGCYNRENRGVAYSRKPAEVEARAHECFHDDLPLTY